MTRGEKDYGKAKIYEIICLTTGERYIGSTCYQYLCQRERQHILHYKKWKKGNGSFISSLPIIERGNYQMLLIENYSCSSQDELSAREGYWIREKECVNKRIEGRNKKQYYQDNVEKIKQYYEDNTEKKKQYQQDNAEKIRGQKKQYYQKNVEKIRERQRQYRQDNAEKIKQQQIQYRQDNAEKIKQRRRQLRKKKQKLIYI
jgi:hypothetical protein